MWHNGSVYREVAAHGEYQPVISPGAKLVNHMIGAPAPYELDE